MDKKKEVTMEDIHRMSMALIGEFATQMPTKELLFFFAYCLTAVTELFDIPQNSIPELISLLHEKHLKLMGPLLPLSKEFGAAVREHNLGPIDSFEQAQELLDAARKHVALGNTPRDALRLAAVDMGLMADATPTVNPKNGVTFVDHSDTKLSQEGKVGAN